MEKTDHLIISQMLELTLQSEEIISEYNMFTLPSLNLSTLAVWEQKMRDFLVHTPLLTKINNTVEEYKSLAIKLGVTLNAYPSLR